MASKRSIEMISLLLFRIGQLILVAGYVCFIVGMATNFWVIRPEVDNTVLKLDTTKIDIIKNYGIFQACKQDTGGASMTVSGGTGGSSGDDDDEEGVECGGMTSLLNFVAAGAVHMVQALMVISCILYFAGFILEIVQILPLSGFRNFLAENRLVEMLSGIASVLSLVAMVVYAGEIKNKAELVPGQEDEAVGWSFVIAIVGLSLSVIGLLMVTMFRHLPVSTIDREKDKGGSWLR